MTTRLNLKFNEDLYYILNEKTEGNAATRVKSVELGQGFEAYQTVYLWFSSTCGMALNKRMDSLMVPASATKPEELAAAIEKWREQLRVVETYGDGYTMSAPFRISALQRLMLNYREKFNVIESMAARECPTVEAQFEHILKSPIEMVAKLRLDESIISSKGHPMEVDGVEDQNADPQPTPKTEVIPDLDQQQPMDANTIW